jgi:hypothetical protein
MANKNPIQIEPLSLTLILVRQDAVPSPSPEPESAAVGHGPRPDRTVAGGLRASKGSAGLPRARRALVVVATLRASQAMPSRARSAPKRLERGPGLGSG